METSPKPKKWKKYECPMEEFEELAMNWLQANRRRLSPKTTTRRLTSLRAFARWAGWGDPLREYSVPIPAKGQAHPLPEGIEGVRRLIAATSNERHQTLVALCGLAGLRVAEALEVRGNDINLLEMTLSIYGKGDKVRNVPVSQEAWNVMALSVARSRLGKNEQVVGLRDRFARRVITQLGVKAGLQRHISSHDLRATFATALYDHTLDQRLVQEFLGHSSGQTTEIYIGRTPAQMREAVESL
jgi:integrase